MHSPYYFLSLPPVVVIKFVLSRVFVPPALLNNYYFAGPFSLDIDELLYFCSKLSEK